MTTPPMSEITPQQAAYAASGGGFLQKLWLDLSGQRPWVTPNADRVAPHRDRREVVSSERMSWPSRWDGATATMVDPSRLAGTSLGGVPMEHAADEMAPVWVTSSMHGNPRLSEAPVPKKPWIEGHPQPGGQWDRHWIGVTDDGTTYELFWLAWVPLGRNDWPKWLRWALPADYPPGPHWEALEMGVWSPDGELMSGVPVTASEEQLSALVVTRDTLTEPHVLGLALDDYHGADGTLGPEHPQCGDHVVLVAPKPSGLTGDAATLWQIASTHGFIISDKTHAPKPSGGVPIQPGAQWAGSNISKFRFELRDLQLVTSR